MISNKKILAVIPARGGSKGIPDKNLIGLAGKPLVAWTVDVARQSKYIDRLIISSDSLDIIRVALDCGCEAPFIRPTHLATDDASGVVPILHAIKFLPGYDYVVMLQPTSPLKDVTDIDGCIEKCVIKNADFCISVTEANNSPYWAVNIDNNDALVPLFDREYFTKRRQDLSTSYFINGAVYVAKIPALLANKSFYHPSTLAYLMPNERSIDIDTNYDLRMAEIILSNDVKNRSF